MASVKNLDFEKDFWETFSGEMRLSELVVHFVAKYPQTNYQYKKIFAEKIIGEKLIGKHLDSSKLLQFIEKQLSMIKLEPIKSNEITHVQEQEESTIYDVDRLTGIQFEEFMVELLNANGYSDSQVTGKTRDQGGDIITHYDNEKIVIQAKNYAVDRKVSNKAVQEVLASIAYYGADRGIVVTNSFFRSSAVEIAKVNNITLWDRRIVSKMLDNYNQAS